jgi:uncharacterized membrane protein YbhN (UPF0104 family)
VNAGLLSIANAAGSRDADAQPLASEAVVNTMSDAQAVEAKGASRRWLSRAQRFWLAALVLAVAGILLGTPLADGDTAGDLATSAGAIFRNLGSMPWHVAPILAVIAALHYVAAALALRAAAGARLPLREVTWVQLAAAAANRLTPAGLGGAAINARYLQRKDFQPVKAVATVGILAGLGAVADMIVFASLVLAGRWVGISGGSHEMAALGAKLNGPWRAVSGLPWPIRAGIYLALAAGIVALVERSRRRRKTATPGEADAEQSRRVWPVFRGLLRQPRRLLMLLAASGATTLLLACGFAFTAMAVGKSSTATFGGLLVGFLIGGAVATAVPTPAGIGATEAALVGVLLIDHFTSASAVITVLMFRVVTFWAPAVVGFAFLRPLRRRQLL